MSIVKTYFHFRFAGVREMRSIRLISYIKKDKFIRRYDGEWAGRKHRRPHTWTGFGLRKKGHKKK